MSVDRPKTHRILVIDDNAAIHDDFRKVLCPAAAPPTALSDAAARLFKRQPTPSRQAVYEVDAAERGQDGVAMISQALDEGRPYAVAFVDMRMPNGWNGLETTRRIWQVAPSTFVVLCTAFSDFSWAQIREELRQHDRFLILKKPFDNIEVQQLAESLCTRATIEGLDLPGKR